MASLGENSYVGTLHYLSLDPPVSGSSIDILPITLDPSANHTGVGQTAPTQTLHVGDGVEAAVNLQIQNPSGSIFIGQSGGTRFGFTAGTACIHQATSVPYVIGTQSGHDMVLGVNNTAILKIDAAGNVGIKTTTVPTDELEVVGNINATGYKVGGVIGFTGTGAYTNFTITNGIITTAT